MNWIGLSLRSLLGIAIGVALGILIFTHGYPHVWVVGACAGLGCALLAEDRSSLRGFSVATAATWAAAFVDAQRLGVSTLHISSTLSFARWLAYIACMGLAFSLGGLSIRRQTRTAGT